MEENEYNVDMITYLKGSGENKDGECGWSCKLKCATSENEEDKKDSFRMEMYAVLNALKAIKGMGVSAEIRSNSQNIVRMCKKEWREIENNKKYKNKDLWKKIHEVKDSLEKAVYFTYDRIDRKDRDTIEVEEMAYAHKAE